MSYQCDPNNVLLESDLAIEHEIASGGEGIAYRLKSGKVYKKYKANRLNNQLIEKLTNLVSKKLDYTGISFPEKIVFSGDVPVGYVMPYASGKPMQTTIFIPSLLLKHFPDWNRVNLVDLCLDILDKIKYLHDNSILLGDINAQNILVHSDNHAYFVDTDSYQIGDHPCPVGQVLFVAPEIQGKNFNSFLRTKDHEAFAIGVLLFMVMHPGKHPFSYQGGGSPADNIKNGVFSYPFGEDVNYKSPQGPWEYIWHELPYYIKELFYNTFTNMKRASISDYHSAFMLYKEDLLSSKYNSDIMIMSKKISERKVSTSINRGGGYNSVGTDATILNHKSPKKGVLELGTRAVKLLVCQNDSSSFSFDDFIRDGVVTNTGDGLDDNNIMDEIFFSTKVLPVIKTMVEKAKRYQVGTLYSVATAAYRTAKNQSNLLTTIHNAAGINVKILSKADEAQATREAYLFSRDYHYNGLHNILLIDQGGGSTEISLFRDKQIIQTFSSNVGTNTLKNIILTNFNSTSSISNALSESDRFAKQKISYYGREKADKQSVIDTCIGVGTPITFATGKQTNRKQHGYVFTKQLIENQMSYYENELNSRFKNIGELFTYIETNMKPVGFNVERTFVTRLGLPVYLNVMKIHDIDKLIVSGTGLWYGIYAQHNKR